MLHGNSAQARSNYHTPTGVFRTGELEQLRMGVLEHLGIAQAPVWLFLSGVARRSGAQERLEETFALCTQCNPRPAPQVDK
ncbi:MAG TPA: hypothetical protein VKB47_06685 [Terracidiphilus sp.]|nr:hypothetical protein [Terracidiphilus sp.]